MKFCQVVLSITVSFASISAFGDVYSFDTCGAFFATPEIAPKAAPISRYPYVDPRVSGSTVLGAGVSGEAVLQPDGTVLKTYHAGPRAKQAKSDAANLALLREFTQGSAEHFLFTEAEYFQDGERQVIRMPFVAGRTVHDLMLDELVPKAIKRLVGQAYGEKLRALRRQLESKGETLGEVDIRVPEDLFYFGDRKLDGLSLLEASLKRAKFRNRILIKTDNVIVDPLNINSLIVIDAL